MENKRYYYFEKRTKEFYKSEKRIDTIKTILSTVFVAGFYLVYYFAFDRR